MTSRVCGFDIFDNRPQNEVAVMFADNSYIIGQTINIDDGLDIS